MISTDKMRKLVNSFSEPISRVTYELASIEKTAEFTLTKTNNTVRIVIILNNNIQGKIGNFKVYDSDNTVACVSDKSFLKSAGKKQYIAFDFNFAERVI